MAPSDGLAVAADALRQEKYRNGNKQSCTRQGCLIERSPKLNHLCQDAHNNLRVGLALPDLLI